MKNRDRILIVDDEPNVRSALAELLKDEGYVVETAADGFKALGKFEQFVPDLVLTDLRMKGLDGIGLIRALKKRDPDVAVLVMTAHAAIDSAVAAIREGAADFMEKPVGIEQLSPVLARVLAQRKIRSAATAGAATHGRKARGEKLVGRSAAMRTLRSEIRHVAGSRAPVLIVGEEGSGKAMTAACIVEQSPRFNRPFLRFAWPKAGEAAAEAALFGRAEGVGHASEPGAKGLAAEAEGGTLLIEEAADLSPEMQKKLHQFVKDGGYTPLGGTEVLRADVRVLATTRRDLPQLVKAGAFREDLFRRFAVAVIEVPTLRARSSDVPMLAAMFLRRFAAENDRPELEFSDAAFARLAVHGWPGNVRELENAVEHAVVAARGDRIEERDLPEAVPPSESEAPPRIPGATLPQLEKYAILRTLEHVGGSTRKAADILAISARTIQYRLREYQASPKPPLDAPGE